MSKNGSVRISKPERLARGLGWFSIGLGLAEIIAPRKVGRWTGVGHRPMLIRLMGLRELASGLGILAQPKPINWVWSRVGGDVMDLAVLGRSLPLHPIRIVASTAAVAGVTALDVMCGRELCRTGSGGNGATHFEASLIVNRPREELYRFWHDFQNFPRFVSHLESVENTGENGRSHWVAKMPTGMTIEWDAEIVNETMNELIAWRSLEGGAIDHAGTVRFESAPAGRGTILRVKMQYRPVGGQIGRAFAKFIGQAPEQVIRKELRRLKQLLETGEITRTEGQPAGRPKSTSVKYDELVRH